jgi:hypothetical protein
MTLTPGAMIIKLFFFITDTEVIELECLSLEHIFLARVVKRLFGLMWRSVFNHVHRMADKDSSLGSSFIVSNVTKFHEMF